MGQVKLKLSGWKATTTWAHDILGFVGRSHSKDGNATQVLEALLHTLHGGFLSGTDAGAGVVVLLVGLFLTLRVSNLLLQIVMVLLLKLANAAPIRPLGVSVNVHLHHSIVHCFTDVLEIRAAAAVEDEAHGFAALRRADLLADVLLRLIQDGRLQFHVARLVHAMHVAEGCGHGEEAVGDFAQGVIDLEDLLGFGVQVFRVRVFVVDAVLFTTCDSQFHLKAAVDLRHSLQVFHANLDVLFQWFL
mmetsp:Transcript_14907/g.32897  ORF Transcript_14907/g.32897 Transcript_14907/m.32897 type:complete len:246 (-) Transcript_14907:761-1498(-)